MEKNNLEGFLEFVKSNSAKDYFKLINNVEFLKSERIKLVGNDFRGFLALTEKEVDKKGIVDSINYINNLAQNTNYDFYIPNSWEGIEKYLRYTILQDLGEEFKKQQS